MNPFKIFVRVRHWTAAKGHVQFEKNQVMTEFETKQEAEHLARNNFALQDDSVVECLVIEKEKIKSIKNQLLIIKEKTESYKDDKGSPEDQFIYQLRLLALESLNGLENV